MPCRIKDRLEEKIGLGESTEVLISLDLTIQNGGLMGFNHEKWWFNGILTNRNGDF